MKTKLRLHRGKKRKRDIMNSNYEVGGRGGVVISYTIKLPLVTSQLGLIIRGRGAQSVVAYM